ncbi:MAG: 50S ribosomal protein L4 [Gemmatimonadales bacterium]|nr:50S ribosomal protein L4 [Gemmatimonadales bacterium]
MLEAPHFSASGTRHKAAFALPAELFDGTVNEPVLHQAVKTFLGNQRQGTAATRTRSFVSGGNQKPWRQKGTGRARQGSTRAPHWRGGGTVFGPQPRDYRTEMPKKVRQLARRSALNARAREGNLLVVDPISMDGPKTKAFAGFLSALGVADRKVLVLTSGIRPALYLSARNIPTARVMPFHEASAYDVLWAGAVVVESGALTGDAEAAAEALDAAPAKAAKKVAKKAAKKAAKAAAPKARAKAAPKAKAGAKKPAARKKKETE